MVPGAFERSRTVSNRIRRDRRCSAGPVDVESRKLRVDGCREGRSERWSESHCEVSGRR